jgi:hypothetical protein
LKPHLVKAHRFRVSVVATPAPSLRGLKLGV